MPINDISDLTDQLTRKYTTLIALADLMEKPGSKVMFADARRVSLALLKECRVLLDFLENR